MVFSKGYLKPGGQKEEKPRQKKRPYIVPLVPENHFFPGLFFHEEPIELEDGELTGPEVTASIFFEVHDITVTDHGLQAIFRVH